MSSGKFSTYSSWAIVFLPSPMVFLSTHAQIYIQPKRKWIFMQICGAISLSISPSSTLLHKFLPPRAPWAPSSVSPIQQDCRLCLGSLSQCYDTETACKQKDRVTIGLTSFVPFFSVITVLYYLLANVWKQLFHIFCPVPSCLQGIWSRRKQVLYQSLPHGPKWKSQSLSTLSYFKSQTLVGSHIKREKKTTTNSRRL